MSAAAAYTFNTDNLPTIPGALWAGGHPGGALNTPLPGLSSAYVPINVYLRRVYESDNHGWTKVKSRGDAKNGWRGSKKSSKNRNPMNMDELISSLGSRSFLVA